jgi:hypothetical protein
MPKLPPHTPEIRHSGSAFIPLETFDIEQIMRKYGVSRRTAFRWKKAGARPGFLHVAEMPSKINYKAIARHTAWRIGKNLYDKDAREEFFQEAMIALWKYGPDIEAATNPEALAYKIALQAVRVAYRQWRYDRLGITDMPEETKRDIVRGSTSYEENPPEEGEEE